MALVGLLALALAGIGLGYILGEWIRNRRAD